MRGGGVLWLDGGLVPAQLARLDPRDRGFTLGDGLFETMRAEGGRVPWLDRHLARLRAGAAVIGLLLPWDDQQLAEAITRTVVANDLERAVVRLSVSRGVPDRRGLLPDARARPTLVIHAQAFVAHPAQLYARGMRAVTSRIVRNERSPLAGVKSLNCLDQVLARREADAAGADEALVSDTADRLVCASAANLFVVLEGTLLTAGLAAGALPGTTRATVIAELAPRLALRVTERAVAPAELARAEEAFLTSVLLGVMPLTALDGRPVGDGVPGPVTGALRAALDAAREEQLSRRLA